MIRDMRPADWPAVAGIFAAGIHTGDATFETEVPTWEEWDLAHLPCCRLIDDESGRVRGWAALSPVSERCVCGGVAEVSVYVGRESRGQGVGRALLEGLILRSEEAGVWTLQAGIFPENLASVAIHARAGFRVVGRRERLGKLNGRWRDVLLLERRSPIIS